MIAHSVNESNKTVIICPPRCGSSRLEEVSQHSKIWSPNHMYTLLEYEEQGYTIYGSVRHPVERFKSWFNGFMLNPYSTNNEHTDLSTLPYEWTLDQLEDFVESFKISMHYDSHTMYQSYIWKSMATKNVTYFEMRYLDVLLQRRKKPIVLTNKWKYLVKTHKDLAMFIEDAATKIYKKDIEWYNNIHKIG